MPLPFAFHNRNCVLFAPGLSFRCVRILLILILGVIPGLARADWVPAGGGSSPPTFSDALAACNYSYQRIYGTPLGPMKSVTYQTGAIRGNVVSISCNYPWIAGSELSGIATLVCPSGTFDSLSGHGGCAPLRQDENGPPSCAVGNPVNVISGNKSETITEFSTRGQFPLTLQRHYDSQWIAPSRMGAGWRTNFDRHFSTWLNGDVYVRLVLGDGREAAFLQGTTSGTWVPSYIDNTEHLNVGRTDVRWSLIQNSSGWIFTDTDGTIETYNTNLQLVSIAYQGGYVQTLNYDSNGNNISVVDSLGRQILFTYSSTGILTSVTAPDGQIYQYQYLEQSPIASGGTATATQTPTFTSVLNKVVFPAALGFPNPEISYLYEDAANLTALTGILDERGVRFATWTYDANLNATSSQHANGAEFTSVQYDFVGNTRTVTNAAGKQTIFSLSAKQGGVRMRVSAIQGQPSANCVAGNTQYGYDSNGYVNQKTDAENRVTTWTNDSSGNQLTQTDASGTALARTTTKTWLSAYQLPTKISKPGLTIDLTYDGVGRLTQRKETDTTPPNIPYTTNGQTRIWSYAYNVAGLLSSVDGPLTGTSDTTTYGYNANGFLTSVTNALNQTTQVTSLNGLGQPLSITDPNSIVTNFGYDARGRIAQIVVNPGPQQAVTTFGYDAAEQVISATEPNGSSLTFEYDGAKRLSAIQNNAGERIEYTSNAMGGITATKVRDSGGTLTKVASKTFDELNRVLTEIGANSQVTQYGYDRTDNVTSVTDPATNTFGYGYDALNRLVSEAGPSLYTVVYGYNTQDRVTTVTDPQGYVTSYYYDGFGDVIGVVSPDSGTTVSTYDARGLLLVEAKSNGVMSSRTYDVLGRLTDIAYPNHTNENIHYAYDGSNSASPPANSIGRLTGMTDQTGTVKYTYTARGKLQSESNTAFGTTYLTQYTYDSSDNVSQIQYPTGDVVTYSRNTLGQVSSVAATIGGVAQTLASSIQYKPFGPWVQMSLPNGITTTRSFDQDYRIASISSTGVLNRSYGFDLRNNILNITDGISSSKSQTFTYDSLGHLQSAFGIYGSLAYTYNASGDRLTGGSSSSPSTYSYLSGTHRLSVVSAPNAHSYTYDGSGNVIADGATTYLFNQENRLLGASSAGDPIYFYDGKGRRAAKYVTGPGSIVYVRTSPGDMMLEAGITGLVGKEYFYLDGEPLAMYSPAAGVNVWVGGTNPTPAKTGSNISDVYYYSNDHLATPQILTGASGAISWSADYRPFGEANVIAPGVTNNLRFPGQYLDIETGFHQNGFRDYASSIGRYLESDPIGLEGGINTYSYAYSNPHSFTDPSGTQVPIPIAPIYPPPLGSLGNPRGISPNAPLLPSFPQQGFLAMYCLANPGLCAASIVANLENQQDRRFGPLCTDSVEDKGCEALYQSVLKTCAGLSGRKRFQCYAAASKVRQQCYQESGQ